MSVPCDILVIGGGPAGATAAALLAEAGHDVVMLEKAAHPRFHIGESLLPANLPLLERLGVAAQVAAIGVKKPGAEFVSDAHHRAVAYPFASGDSAARPDYSYQVPRAAFDAILFANALRRGARGVQNTRVIAARLTQGAPAEITAIGAGGETLHFAPRFVLDASGRDTFLATRARLKTAHKHNNTAAIFGHFRNVACHRDGRHGYISIHLAENGWFWFIPLPDGVTSVGFVGNQAAFRRRGADIEEFFRARIAASPSVAQRMAPAVALGAVTATGNYSYRARAAGGDGYFLIGDAFAFIDPIFSSGVMLAMRGAELGAGVASAWLADRRAGLRLARQAEARMRRSLDGLDWLIRRINTPALRDMFMAPQDRFGMRAGLVSLLAGDLDAPRLHLPVLAFKASFHLLNAMRRLGYQLQPDGSLLRAGGGEGERAVLF